MADLGLGWAESLGRQLASDKPRPSGQAPFRRSAARDNASARLGSAHGHDALRAKRAFREPAIDLPDLEDWDSMLEGEIK